MSAAGSAAGLRRLAAPRRADSPAPGPAPGPAGRGEVCELCGLEVGPGHGHLVDLARRGIRCACRPCYLLFTGPADQARYRAIPQRYAVDPEHPITDAEWEELQIPVGTAFFFTNSQLGRVIACYPSPAGATECELDLACWGRLAVSHPLLRAPADDVEAILVTRRGAGRTYFLVPIDACYQLVGLVRTQWRGFDGGAEVHQGIEELLTGLADLAQATGVAATGTTGAAPPAQYGGPPWCS